MFFYRFWIEADFDHEERSKNLESIKISNQEAQNYKKIKAIFTKLWRESLFKYI